MPRRLVALAVVPLMMLVAACGSGEKTETASGELDGVTVSGEVGKVPKVEIDGPLKVEKTQTEVIESGDGNDVVADKKALLHMYIGNGTSGEKAATSYDQGTPVALDMTEEQLFPAVLDAIVGQPVGSRVAVTMVPKDAYGDSGAEQLGLTGKDPVVFVVDIMSVEPTDVVDGPEGEPAANVPADIPTVKEADGKVTGLSWENAPKKPAKKLQVIPLVDGDGPAVRDDSLVTFNYLGQIYGSDKVFDESYTREPTPFPVGVGGLIPAWDKALVGLDRGSRVLIIAPPKEGYGEQGNPQAGIKGTDTLVFVVDILGVDEPS